MAAKEIHIHLSSFGGGHGGGGGVQGSRSVSWESFIRTGAGGLQGSGSGSGWVMLTRKAGGGGLHGFWEQRRMRNSIGLRWSCKKRHIQQFRCHDYRNPQ